MILLLLACTPYGIHVPPVDTAGIGGDDAGLEAPERIVDSSPETTEPDDTGGGGGTDPEAEALYDAFYDLSVVQQVHIELTDDAMSDLRRDPTTYVPGNVVIGDTRLENVGVRLKGSSSFRDLSGKAAFKIRFNAFEDQHYATLERATFNNMTGDPTQSKEVIGYHVFREGGVPVPHANYAQVWLNDTYYGLYSNLEAMDEHLLKRWYDDNDGDLWEGNDNADFSRRSTDYFELVTGVGDRTDLEAAATAVRGSDFMTDAGAVLDLPQFLDFWAYSLAIGDGDGYPYHLNDYFVYQDPADGRFDFFPWGIDESWDPYLQWSYASGTVATGCLDDADCEDLLKDHVRDALDVYESLDLVDYADRIDAATDGLLDLETRGEWSPSEVRNARADLDEVLPQWPEDLRRQMDL
jgi:hypothetical protein